MRAWTHDRAIAWLQHLARENGRTPTMRHSPKAIAIPIEANLRTGIWRGALPDEMHLWDKNPWAPKGNGR